jgi:FkbM family methyltransferase
LTALQSRKVVLEGVEVAIAGRGDDPYFAHLGEAPDNALLADAVRFLPHSPVIFDVGANMGVTSAILASRLPHATIYSFEPDPEPFSYLTETMRLNGFGHCQPIHIALGARPGELSFLHNTDSSGASHLVTDETLGGGNRVVQVSTVDLEMHRLGVSQLHLIKIDVEGFETDVLAGAGETLRRHQPLVLLEFNSFAMMAFRDVYPRAFLERLTADFPFVYRHTSAGLTRVESTADKIHFLHDNLVHKGCVDDLLCAWTPLNVGR